MRTDIAAAPFNAVRTRFFEEHGVGLSDGAPFGAPGFVRLNFGCRRSLLTEALGRMKRGVRLVCAARGGIIDETALLFDEIEISAGKVGVGVLVPVEPLVALLNASLVDLTA